MQRFQKILFVHESTSNQEMALRRAAQLARSNNAQLTLVNVGQELPRSLPNLQKAFGRVQEDQLKSLIGKVGVEGVDVRTRRLVGTPFIEIIKEVMHGDHDLVIKPAEGRGGLGNMLFGSTDLHLLRKCPCPVWIIKPSRKKKFARILAAVDPDPGEEANAELNHVILDLATSLAHQEGSELHVVHAWSLAYESMLRSGRAPLPKSEVDRMVRMTRQNHKKWLHELLASRELQAKVHLLKGDSGDVISALARKKRVELIVMGTVARTGIPGFFIGNTAEKTLAVVDCSVLAVKPAAFSTPIEA